MRSLFFVLSAIFVMGLAFWAYQENYKTQQALKDMRALHNEIGKGRARLAVLRAEWAYQNRPERLLELADINFDSLGLLPLQPTQFARVDQVGYPAPELPLITESIEVSGELEGTE
jgi:hypothetical protein